MCLYSRLDIIMLVCIYMYIRPLAVYIHSTRKQKRIKFFFFGIGNTLYENLDKYFVKISQTAFGTFIHKCYTSYFPFHSNFNKKSFHILICTFRDFRF